MKSFAPARYQHLLLVCAVLAGLGLAPSRGHAQAQATIQIPPPSVGAGVGQGPNGAAVDPHPAIYGWAGDPRPVRDVGAEFYTFYYVGVVRPDGTADINSPIDRIAVPNSQWDANKSVIVNTLAGYYAQGYGAIGPPAPGSNLNQVKFDENFNYVDTGPAAAQPNYKGIDPKAAAEWTFYYDQLVLWQFYCRRILLNDRNATKANSSPDEIRRRVEGALLASNASFKDVDVAKVLSEADKVRKAQEQRLNSAARPGGPQPRTVNLSPASRASSAAQAASQLVNMPNNATQFDPDADFADPKHNEMLWEDFNALAAIREGLATGVFRSMLSRIENRRTERERYDDWVKERQQGLYEFARAWSKVQSGERINLDDTFYLLTKQPLESVPTGSKNVVVREVVTPQDLIARDGRLKGQIVEEEKHAIPPAPSSGKSAIPPAPASGKPAIPPAPAPPAGNP